MYASQVLQQPRMHCSAKCATQRSTRTSVNAHVVCVPAQEMYLKRKSFAFNSDRPGAGGEDGREVFERSMATVDMTFQNLDSSEISLTDVSHYFDSDPTNLVQSLRKDGRKPNSYVADTTTANAQVRLALCAVRSRGVHAF